ncbi:MAG: TIGR03086 family metal-binding protein [Microthrixaceae bacterium]
MDQDDRASTGGPAGEHRRIAGEFTETVEGVAPDAWDAPAPPEGWVARDVVRHLVEWFPAFLQGSVEIALPDGPSVDDDPAGAWRAQTDAVQTLLDDPEVAGAEHEFEHLGTMTLGQAISMVYIGDVFLHRWDLARATGQDETLDPDRCAAMLEGMLPMNQALRQSGHYGPRVEVPDDADAQTRLLAFIGRTP